MIVVLLGAPGSGKGTQAKRLCERFGWVHLSTGDLLREEIRDQTALGTRVAGLMASGQLVSDEIILRLVEKRFSRERGKTFVLDGFPRNLEQAKTLLQRFHGEIFRVVFFAVSDGVVVKRLSGRRTCYACGSAFHIEYQPSSRSDLCDRCDRGVLIQRSDDNAETVVKRISIYRSQTEPMINLLRQLPPPSGFLEVDGSSEPDVVFERILPFLAGN